MLALGVFLVSVLALIGLLAPMLRSVSDIEKLDEITSVVNTVNAFLQSSPDIALRDTNGNVTQTRFDGIYQAVSSNGSDEATIFVFRYFDDTSSDSIRLEVGFSPDENDDGAFLGSDSIVDETLFQDAAGPIYRVVLTVSPVTPLQPVPLRTDPRDADTGIYALTQDLVNYPEGSLAFEARIFAEDPPGPGRTFETETDLSALSIVEPDFTFSAAIVR